MGGQMSFSRSRRTGVGEKGYQMPGSPAWYMARGQDPKQAGTSAREAGIWLPEIVQQQMVGGGGAGGTGAYGYGGAGGAGAGGAAPGGTPSTGAGTNLVDYFIKAMEEANQANQARYEEGLGLLEQSAGLYAPGGGFGAGALADIERAKGKDIASATQSLVSSGLYGTTIAAGLPKKYEEEVSGPARLRVEDIRKERYAGALGQKAGFIERRTDKGPEMGLFASLMQGASSGPTGWTWGY